MKLHEILRENAKGQRDVAASAKTREKAPNTRHYECLQAITQRENAEGNARDCERMIAEVPDRDFDAWGELQFRACLKKLFGMRHDSREYRNLLIELIVALKSTMPVAA